MAIRYTRYLSGQYNAYGYRIYDQDGRQVYAAGNHPLDSQARAPSLACAVPVSLLAVYCETTGMEMAAECGAAWLGACLAEGEPDDAD